MSRLLTAYAVTVAIIHVASGFSAAPTLAQLLRPAQGSARLRSSPAAARWTASDDGYKIVPSQLEGTGGGWTIQGVKPVSVTPLRALGASHHSDTK